MAEDPTTWAELKTSARAWLTDIDTGAVSDGQLEEFIAFAERHFQRTVFSPEREIVADLTIDAEEESTPADMWGLKGIHLATDPKTVLEAMSLADLRNTYASNTTGKPQNYAIRGEKFVFGPAPDATYTAKVSYIQTIPALASGNTTNWLLTDHPDVYLAGALHFAFLFLMDEARAALWAGKMETLIAEINEASQRRLSGAAPLRIRSPQVV